MLALEKSIGAIFFLAGSVVLFVLQARGVTQPLQNLFAEELREDPHDLIANLLIGLLPQVSRGALRSLTLIATAYFVLHVIEALGLWLGRLWVEYLILVETAAFVPYEVFEIARHVTWFKVLVLIVNALIVCYLAGRRLRARRTTAASLALDGY